MAAEIGSPRPLNTFFCRHHLLKAQEDEAIGIERADNMAPTQEMRWQRNRLKIQHISTSADGTESSDTTFSRCVYRL